ncbi:MAG: DUF4214 domain-containing protein [Pseudomonadota bacterium]
MPTVSDITSTPLSGLNHIDALLDLGPDWNFLTPGGNTLLYTFSIGAGNEAGQSGQQAFSAAQQVNARAAMLYLASITGIAFVETASGDAAQVHLCNVDISGAGTSGLCSWNSSYSHDGNNHLISYSADAYVYLDNHEWAAQNANLAPGGSGYETLLHELGHMLGLKHPFDDAITLPKAQDSTVNTLMSYTELGGPYATFRPYDIAALNWLYGRDGLGGALGIGSQSGARFVTGTTLADTLVGTPFNDTLEGDGGNDMLNGGDGIDTAVFGGDRAAYTITQNASGQLLVVGPDGSDTLDSIEVFQFTDASYQRAQLVDSTPPAAPTATAAKNAAGFVVGNQPLFTGIGEPFSSIKLFSGASVIASATVDATGFWTAHTGVLANGSYNVYANATDAAGNASPLSAAFRFNVDATPPSVPSATVAASGNQPQFSGTAEPGTTLNLVDGASTVLGSLTVGAGGSWTLSSNPLANGNYHVTVQSLDAADNLTLAAAALDFSISSALNRTGTAGNDVLTGSAGNNAIDGQGGIDTAVYAGTHVAYSINQSTNGFTIAALSGNDGLDSLLNVERIRFADSTVAIDIHGDGGQAYRLYQAAFNRAPDMGGLGFWIAQMDHGISLHDVAAGFMGSAEFASLYGANPSTVTFVANLYQNVLHRALDQSGFDFWVGAINQGVARADVLVQFSESPENQAQLIGVIGHGFEYIPLA